MTLLTLGKTLLRVALPFAVGAILFVVVMVTWVEVVAGC